MHKQAPDTGAARPCVAHIMIPYIQYSEGFLYEKLTHHHAWRPIVLTDEAPRNTDRFPFEPVYSLAEQPGAVQVANKAARRITRRLPFFEQVVANNRVRVLHAHFGQVGNAMLAFKRTTGLPLITGFYGNDISDAALDASPELNRYRDLFAEGDLFVALSRDMRDRMIDYGCPADRIVIRRLAVDIEDFSYVERNFASGDRIELLAVGRFVEKKGFAWLVERFGRVMERAPRPARLTIIGDGPEMPAVQEQVQRFGIEKNVVLPGAQPRAEVCTAMAAAHVFVVSSMTPPDGGKEGTPTVIMEAQARGLPVLAMDHAGVAETVLPGRSAHIVPEFDAAAFEEKLLHLMNHPETWEPMGKAGREFVLEHHEINAVCRLHEQDYQNLSR